jgi:hypothetical protein
VHGRGGVEGYGFVASGFLLVQFDHVQFVEQAIDLLGCGWRHGQPRHDACP